MRQTIHRIVQNADTLIVLKTPNAVFVPWPHGEDEDVEECGTGESESEEHQLKEATEATESEKEVVDGAADEDEDEEVWYYVSRSRLMDASPVFKAMMSDDLYKEGTCDEDDGLFHVNTEDWDAEALLHLLNILHDRHHLVPREFSLEMLAKISVLVDYYRCEQETDEFVEDWVDHLKENYQVPNRFCRDLLLWMSVTWVFKWGLNSDAYYTTMSRIVFERSYYGELYTGDLPILLWIETIQRAHSRKIEPIIVELRSLFDGFPEHRYDPNKFLNGESYCGALSKGLEAEGWFPLPTERFHELEMSKLQTALRKVKGRFLELSVRVDPHYDHLAQLLQMIIEVYEIDMRDLPECSLRDLWNDHFDRP